VVAIIEGRRAAAAEIGARAERAAGSRDDDGADGVIAVGLVECRHHLVEHRGIQRVQPVRPVQGNGGHAVGD
jgi:hypothetical protein